MVSAVRTAWPNADRESDTILRTLEESLAINAVARTGTAWDSSERRAQWMRGSLAARLSRGARARIVAEGHAEGRLQPHDPRRELRQHLRCRSDARTR